MVESAALLVFSAVCTLLLLRFLIPRLKERLFTGIDRHKPGEPEIPEMGGLALVGGVVASLLAAIAMVTFTGWRGLDVVPLLAVVGVVGIVAVIGVVDDVLGIPQGMKAFLPGLAALPLMAIRAGHSSVLLPFVGSVELGPFHSLLLIPLGVTGASNAVNMLAGFNGLEAGMGVVAFTAMAAIAYMVDAPTAMFIAFSAVGGLLALLYFNWYPSRVFVGDVGTLTIGTLMAATVIVGHFQLAGIILIVPYVFDFLLKARHGFPSHGWWGVYRDGKLYCPGSPPVGLCQWILKVSGGLTERALVVRLIAVEALLGAVAWLVYAV